MSWKVVLGRVIFGLLFGAASLWTARLSILAIQRRSEWIRDGLVVEGEIVGFEERADTDPSERRPLYAPVVSFERAGGQTSRFTSSRAVRPNPYSVGQKIPVRYLKSRPLEADLDSVTGSLLAIVVLLTFTIVCLGVAILPIVLPAPARH